jgi:hypothetical protein
VTTTGHGSVSLPWRGRQTDRQSLLSAHFSLVDQATNRSHQ